MKLVFIISLLLIHSLPITYASEAVTKLTFLGTNQKTILNPEVAREYQFEIEVFNLDELSDIEAEISNNLPKDPVEAERIADERMGSLDKTKAMRLFKGVALLIEWDIKKLPAFIFGEGQYVIYGVTNTATAINRFVNSRKRK
jgi:integrating conjugative element protein (TIGR03757 family)